MREVSITQLPIEAIIAPVDKSDPSFDLQADIIFGGNGGAKINKFLEPYPLFFYLSSISLVLFINISNLAGNSCCKF